MTEIPPDEPPLLGRYSALYTEALRARWVWGAKLSTMPGRQRLSDDGLRAYIDGALVTRPGAHGNGEYLVALWLNRIICTGPRWRRLWAERVSAAVQRANATEADELHPLALEVSYRSRNPTPGATAS